MGKRVIANDYLWSNYWTAVSFIENDCVTLSEADLTFMLDAAHTNPESNFVATTFSGFYFTEQENSWLDSCRHAIDELGRQYPEGVARYKQALAFHCLFQSALRKRPFNMFHRRNLYLRLADVPREFGNATTWRRPFVEHFREFASEARTIVFSNKRAHEVHNRDAISWELPPAAELVYLDPPYVWRGASQAEVDYLPKYHFLEGLWLPIGRRGAGAEQLLVILSEVILRGAAVVGIEELESNLDEEHQEKLYELLQELLSSGGIGQVIATAHSYFYGHELLPEHKRFVQRNEDGITAVGPWTAEARESLFRPGEYRRELQSQQETRRADSRGRRSRPS